jgi:hypothetical protein
VNPRRLLYQSATLLLVLALAGSGIYVLVYLARWEWVRAQIAGLFFLAALISFATGLILRRIDGLRATQTRPTAAVDPVTPASPFPWLYEAKGSTHVFLPVLLGFGLLLGLLAAGVERLVGLAAGPRMSALRTEEPPASWPVRLLVAFVAFVVAGTVAWGAVNLMTREEESIAGTRTYTLQVAINNALLGPLESVEELALFCRDRADLASQQAQVSQIDGSLVRLEVTPIPGRFGTHRFDGCLQDLVLDHRSVSIVDKVDSQQ